MNSSSQIGSGASFAAPVRASNPLSSFSQKMQRAAVKMSATSSNFDGPEYFNKSLNDLKNNADQKKSTINRRTSVVMQASKSEPVVSGVKSNENEHLKEGFQDMMFYHNQYVTLADVPHQTKN